MTDYEKLEKLINDAKSLIEKRVTVSDVDFCTWKVNVERFINKQYGGESIEYKDFKKTTFEPVIIPFETTHNDFVSSCCRGIKKTRSVLVSYLDDFNEQGSIIENNTPHIFSKVFIVHGHDGELKESVARIIEKQGIEAIILSEQANQGRTIIEKFEDYSDVSGAVCLFTADDKGNKKSESEMNMRARQNVVFETGFFMGKLGRDHVIILADKGVEIPSDLAGVVYTDAASWQFDLLKELNAIGYTVDANKLL